MYPNDAQFADGYTVQLKNNKVVAYGRDDEFEALFSTAFPIVTFKGLPCGRFTDIFTVISDIGVFVRLSRCDEHQSE
ncbi:hypothetical protein N9K67_09085 [Opitutaceae bacterium]|nr:hypothetical protein [Opitutaceae bacterium]